MTAKKIRLTAAHLEAADACPEQVDRFRATFPKGARLTAAALRKAQAAGLNVLWTICLLDGSAREKYQKATTSAWAEYHRTRVRAEEKYQKATASVRGEYEAANACGASSPAWREYQKVVTSAREAYRKATIPAWGKYQQTTAPALLTALRSTLSRKGVDS